MAEVNRPVFVKQALEAEGFLIVVDAAGQVWYRPLAAALGLGRGYEWARVKLPCAENTDG